MKVAVSATGADIEAGVDPRFGRCAYFILVDPDTMEWEAFSNEAGASAHGAGIGAAQAVANAGANAVISGHVGPNAYQTLQAAGVKVYTVAEGSVRSAVAAFKAGELSETRSPTVGGHFGRGGGRS